MERNNEKKRDIELLWDWKRTDKRKKTVGK